MRASGVRIGVLVDSAPWTGAVPGAAALARRAARAALEATAALPDAKAPAAPRRGEIAIVLADDATVARLNRDYRRKDKPTNVLAFPLGDADALRGDVVLARETVLAEAQAQGKRPGDHLAHLVVHGVLHLLGYVHGTDAAARRMEALERRVLAGLGVADPYDGSTTATPKARARRRAAA